VKGVVGILAALCVAFNMVASVSAHPRQDYVTRGLLCIHGYEGGWRDAGAPFWGGLQMDYSFQSVYGYTYVKVHGRRVRINFLQQWGTADHWPIGAQMEAGRNGYKSRGWSPWPNTARMCGLY